MDAQSSFNFQWLSPVGIGAALFLSHGLLLIFLGFLVFWLYRRPGATQRFARTGRGGVILSMRGDSQYFGGSINETVQDSITLATVVDLLMTMRAGLWLAFGIFETALIWFGVRGGLAWAFWTVVLANLAALASWILISVEFIRKGVRLDLNLPPVVFVYAAIITPVAALLGWIGLR